MTHNKIYGFCENLCKEEILSKEQTKTGTFPDMTAGHITPTEYVEDKAVFSRRVVNRDTHTDIAKVEGIVGCTVGWNQLLQDAWYQSFANSHNNKSGLTITKNADLSVHIQGTTTAQFKNYTDCTANYIDGHQYIIIADKSEDVQVFNGYGGTYADSIVTYNNTAQTRLNHLYIQIASGITVNTDLRINIVDLTVALGSSVANRLKAMGTDGVEWCRNWIKNANHSYSALSMETVNVSEKKITDTSGTIHSYPLDESLLLKGLFKVDENGNIYCDGDIYKPDGSVTIKYSVVNPNVLNWQLTSGRFNALLPTIRDGVSSVPDFIYLTKYQAISPNEWYQKTKTGISVGMSGYAGNQQLLFYDPTCTTVEEAKAALSGIYIIYERKTPNEETSLPYNEFQICNNGAIEEFIDAGIEAETRDVSIPVGQIQSYPSNYRDVINAMIDKVFTPTQG